MEPPPWPSCPTVEPTPVPHRGACPRPPPVPHCGARPHVCGGSLSSPSLCFSFSVLFTTVVALGVYHAHMLSVHGCWRCFPAFIPKHALHHCRFCSLQRRQTVIQQPPALITFAHSSPYNMRPHFPGDRVKTAVWLENSNLQQCRRHCLYLQAPGEPQNAYCSTPRL